MTQSVKGKRKTGQMMARESLGDPSQNRSESDSAKGDSSRMPLTKELKGGIIEQYRVHEKDTGSSDVQVAMLSSRITQLTGHLKTHPHDHSSRRGLLKLVSQRRHFLTYLTRTNPERYRDIIAGLGLRK